MSNSARLTLIAFPALVLPACYSSGNHTTMTPVGPPGSPDAFARTSPAHNATVYPWRVIASNATGDTFTTA